MAPPKRPWFRFYVEAVHDRKLRRLTPAQRWLWVAILASARSSPNPPLLLVAEGEPMTAKDLADWSDVPVATVRKALVEMERFGMLERVGDTLSVTNFAERQYESDSSTSRVARHRTAKQQQCNGLSTDDVTPPETETETETDNSPSTTGSPGSDAEVEAVIARIVETRYEADKDSVRNPQGWRIAVRTEVVNDGTPDRIREMRRRYPTASVTQLADAVEGRTQVLRYLPRSEEAS